VKRLKKDLPDNSPRERSSSGNLAFVLYPKETPTSGYEALTDGAGIDRYVFFHLSNKYVGGMPKEELPSGMGLVAHDTRLMHART